MHPYAIIALFVLILICELWREVKRAKEFRERFVPPNAQVKWWRQHK